ncbi:unnamed protein product [Choristocarpus tenellus]
MKAVVCLETRPEGIENVLYVCPECASIFGGRHLRLAWMESTSAPGWVGYRGLVRVHIDTALQPQDPAVFMLSTTKGPVVEDPVVDLSISSVPPHFLQPWAAVEINSQGLLWGRRRGEWASITNDPIAALEYLEGAVVRNCSIRSMLMSPADRHPQEVMLCCRRNPQFTLPFPIHCGPDSQMAMQGGQISEGIIGNEHATGCKDVGGCLITEVEGNDGGYESLLSRAGSVRGGDDGVEQDRARQRGRERGRGRRMERGDGSQYSQPLQGGKNKGWMGTKNMAGGEERIQRSGELEKLWVCRLHEWGFVTTDTTIIIQNPNLEVQHLDRVTASQGSIGCRDAESVIGCHDSTVVESVSASLEMTVTLGRQGVKEEGWVGDKSQGRHVPAAETGSGGGTLLIHGPPGVGKTLLVEALAGRLRCRLVKLSPGNLLAGAGVDADR